MEKNEKTLYISDLDGTLLDTSAALSEYACAALNRMIAEGLEFSIATARTSETTKYILKNLNLRVPIVLMNGALVFDTAAGRYIRTVNLDEAALRGMFAVLREHDITGFLYCLEGERLVTLYESLESPALRSFHDDRVKRYNKVFGKVDSFAEALGGNVIYLTLRDSFERLSPVLDKLKNILGIEAVIYPDNYAEGLWYIECFGKDASKYNAVRFLREACGYDKIVGFGDNLNDLSLFRACDECYAVGNAQDAVKQAATGVLKPNTEDGVIRFLEEQ